MVPNGRRLTRRARKSIVETIETTKTRKSLDKSLDKSIDKSLNNFDEDNLEIMVKVFWESKLQKHPLRMVCKQNNLIY